MSVQENTRYDRLGAYEGTATVSVTNTAAAHSSLAHGAAVSPAVSFSFTVKDSRPNIRLHGFLPYVGLTVIGIVSWHIILNGTCRRQSAIPITTASVGLGQQFSREITGLAAGAYTCALQLRIESGTGTPSAFLAPDAANPIQIYADEIS